MEVKEGAEPGGVGRTLLFHTHTHRRLVRGSRGSCLYWGPWAGWLYSKATHLILKSPSAAR